MNANIDSLLKEVADLKEAIRWREKSLANVDPRYQANAAYIARLKAEISKAKADLKKAEDAVVRAANQQKPPTPSTSDDKKQNDDKAEKPTAQATGTTDLLREATRKNPLSDLSNYIYHVTLYMVTPKVHNDFVNGGGTMKGITSKTPGVIVVTQTGGTPIDDKILLSKDGARRDYYIDDVRLTTYHPLGTNKASASTDIKFSIVEPYGFAFIQDLTNAGFSLNENNDPVAGNMPGIKQHYILGISFKGYDVEGGVISDNAIEQRYFAIKITKMKFKLDGKIVKYNCDAVVMSEAIANGQVNGTLPSGTTLEGKTVGEVLADATKKHSLVSVLNSLNATAKDNKQIEKPIKYKIEFLDDKIKNQALISDEAFNAKISKTFGAKTTESTTIKDQLKATSFDPTKHSIQLTAGQSILTIIDNIITKSEYVTGALNQINTADDVGKNKSRTPKKLSWYSVNPVVTVTGTDKITNDWTYEIKFQIAAYEVPYARIYTATAVSTYPGPIKRYEYWLKGLNSEILSYEQQYDNLYYVATIAAMNEVKEREKNMGVAQVHTQGKTGGDSTGSEGKNMQYSQDAVAQLYSPADTTKIKMKIMGDPDYISSMLGVNNSGTASRTFQLNPLQGQKFIEIDFGMGSEYLDDGLLDIGGSIQFYGVNTIKNDLKISGVVYRILAVESNFVKGAFTQTLELYMVDQTALLMPTKGIEEARPTPTSSTQSPTSGSNTNYSNEGRTKPRPSSANDDNNKKYETPYDRMNRQNREREALEKAERLKKIANDDGTAERIFTTPGVFGP